MPAFLTHVIAADEVRDRLKNARAKQAIDANYGAYQSGAQGGDYFSNYKYYSMWAGHTYKLFGYALHRVRPQRFFVEAAEYAKKKASPLLNSFFYGYITHYCLDYLLHPLVIKLAPKMLSEHNTLEYALDTVYAHTRGIDAVEFDRGAFLNDTFVPGEELNDFFYEMFQKLFYGFKIKPHIYTDAYKYYEKFSKKMHMPGKWRMRLIKLENIFTLLDLKSILCQPYEKVKDRYDYEPFLELIEKAVERSLALIDITDGFIYGERDKSVIESAFYNVNFSGKPLVPREEQKAFRKAYNRAKLKLF